MKDALKILYVTSELTPLLSTGGLADVANALPRALHARGHDVRLVMPCYANIPEEHRGEQCGICEADFGTRKEYGALRVSRVPGSDIRLYLIEHEGYFGREHPYGIGAYEYEDNAERFCFFSLALLHSIPQTGWAPDLLHCHDWHTAPIPAFLKTRYQDDAVWGGVPTVFTIHNVVFQGRYGAGKWSQTGLEPELLRPDCAGHETDMNLLKAAICFATKITTVSPRYAREIQTLEYGAGLDGMLRTRSKDFRGIMNGVDYRVWSPATDPHIPAHYTQDDLSGKKACKAGLQEAFGFAQRDVPLFGVVSRLYWQKGLDLVVDALDRLMEIDLQIVILGKGDPQIEQRLAEAARRYPDRLAVALRFDVPLSHLVQAGSDFFLMPSRYEPCGLSQLYGLAYGAIPVVRRTGGLADSVRGLNPVRRKNGTATGITFVPLTPEALVRSMRRAVALYGCPEELARMRRACMDQDFSWDRSCEAYLEVYREAIAVEKKNKAGRTTPAQ